MLGINYWNFVWNWGIIREFIITYRSYIMLVLLSASQIYLRTHYVRMKLPVLYCAPRGHVEVPNRLKSGLMARAAGLPPLYQLPPKWSSFSLFHSGFCRGFLPKKEFPCNKRLKITAFPWYSVYTKIYNLLMGLFGNIY